MNDGNPNPQKKNMLEVAAPRRPSQLSTITSELKSFPQVKGLKTS